MLIVDPKYPTLPRGTSPTTAKTPNLKPRRSIPIHPTSLYLSLYLQCIYLLLVLARS